MPLHCTTLPFTAPRLPHHRFTADYTCVAAFCAVVTLTVLGPSTTFLPLCSPAHDRCRSTFHSHSTFLVRSCILTISRVTFLISFCVTTFTPFVFTVARTLLVPPVYLLHLPSPSRSSPWVDSHHCVASSTPLFQFTHIALHPRSRSPTATHPLGSRSHHLRSPTWSRYVRFCSYLHGFPRSVPRLPRSRYTRSVEFYRYYICVTFVSPFVVHSLICYIHVVVPTPCCPLVPTHTTACPAHTATHRLRIPAVTLHYRVGSVPLPAGSSFGSCHYLTRVRHSLVLVLLRLDLATTVSGYGSYLRTHHRTPLPGYLLVTCCLVTCHGAGSPRAVLTVHTTTTTRLRFALSLTFPVHLRLDAFGFPRSSRPDSFSRFTYLFYRSVFTPHHTFITCYSLPFHLLFVYSVIFVVLGDLDVVQSLLYSLTFATIPLSLRYPTHVPTTFHTFLPQIFYAHALFCLILFHITHVHYVLRSFTVSFTFAVTALVPLRSYVRSPFTLRSFRFTFTVYHTTFYRYVVRFPHDFLRLRFRSRYVGYVTVFVPSLLPRYLTPHLAAPAVLWVPLLLIPRYRSPATVLPFPSISLRLRCHHTLLHTYYISFWQISCFLPTGALPPVTRLFVAIVLRCSYVPYFFFFCFISLITYLTTWSLHVLPTTHIHFLITRYSCVTPATRFLAPAHLALPHLTCVSACVPATPLPPPLHTPPLYLPRSCTVLLITSPFCLRCSLRSPFVRAFLPRYRFSLRSAILRRLYHGVLPLLHFALLPVYRHVLPCCLRLFPDPLPAFVLHCSFTVAFCVLHCPDHRPFI